ncbi:MAG: CoA ester lyase [Hahellaceae bacterium]|nr:CoA ester lyase [Hahellaceae bacterium]
MTLTTSAYPGWRSLLFIPVHIDKFVEKAASRGADAYILDLEDSVPLAEKESARRKVIAAARQVSAQGAAALVRINLNTQLAVKDIEASVSPEVAALVIPKVESAAQVKLIADLIDQHETDKGMVKGRTRLIAMIESVEALPHLDAIASASPRLLSITLGSEDFSASAGMAPIPEALMLPNQMIVYACRRAGLYPLGFPASIADYSDLEAFGKTIRLARNLGFVGALCIHPKQAEILNREFLPSRKEIEQARGLIEAYEIGIAEGKGAVEYNGKMIDLPVVKRAMEMIVTWETFQHPH